MNELLNILQQVDLFSLIYSTGYVWSRNIKEIENMYRVSIEL